MMLQRLHLAEMLSSNAFLLPLLQPPLAFLPMPLLLLANGPSLAHQPVQSLLRQLVPRCVVIELTLAQRQTLALALLLAMVAVFGTDFNAL